MYREREVQVAADCMYIYIGEGEDASTRIVRDATMRTSTRGAREARGRGMAREAQYTGNNNVPRALGLCSESMPAAANPRNESMIDGAGARRPGPIITSLGAHSLSVSLSHSPGCVLHAHIIIRRAICSVRRCETDGERERERSYKARTARVRPSTNGEDDNLIGSASEHQHGEIENFLMHCVCGGGGDTLMYTFL